MESIFEHMNWAPYLTGSIANCFPRFSDMLMRIIKFCIPRKSITEHVSSHPLITPEILQAFASQESAFGTDAFSALRRDYLAKIASAKMKYLDNLRSRIASLPRNDKRWWLLNREFFQGKVKLTNVPSLKDTHGAWVTDSRDKANLFKDTWQQKFVLRALSYDDQFCFHVEPVHCDFIKCRSRACERIIRRLKED